jgi:hypothetical protein
MWVDVTNVPGVLDWWAFCLGALGIGFTVVQLFRSSGALKSAAKALRETRSTLIRNQLMSILPGFEEISKSVDSALRDDDRQALQEAIGRFAFRAHESAALLQDSTTDYAPLIFDILRVAEAASSARTLLFSDLDTPLGELVGEVTSDIRGLAPKVSGASVAIRNDPGKVKKDA